MTIVPPKYANPWLTTIYQPLILPKIMNPMPHNYLQDLPKFSRQSTGNGNEHIASIIDYVEDIFIKDEDVYVHLFMHSFEVVVRAWFKNLTINSISTWKQLQSVFLRWCREPKVPFQLLTDHLMKWEDSEGAKTVKYGSSKVDIGTHNITDLLVVFAKITCATFCDPHFLLHSKKIHSPFFIFLRST